MRKKSVYLVFSKTGTWLSRLISLFIEGKYVHSSISLDDSFTQMYSFGRTTPNNPFSAGFVEESLYDGVYKRFSGSECLIYRLKVTEEQYDTLEDEINRFLIEKGKYKYNFLGLFGVLFNKSVERRNYYFCTQFVSEVLIKTNIYSTVKNPALIRTDDLISIEEKEIIYEGFVNTVEAPSAWQVAN
jgi:hypothetical protein